MVEYALELYFLPGLKSMLWLKVTGTRRPLAPALAVRSRAEVSPGAHPAGAALVVAGMWLRAAALYTAQGSFNHLVQTRKAQNHRLVTTGVYAYVLGAPLRLGLVPRPRAWVLGS